MTHDTRDTRRPLLALLGCAALLGLASCAQVPDAPKGPPKAPPVFVYPPPPDEARFFFERMIVGSASVEPVTEESKLKLLLTGDAGRTNIRMMKPYAVAVHRGRIFVSDTAMRIVHVYDVPQGHYFMIGTDDPGRLVKPFGLDVDGSGNLYVADGTAKTIQVYDRDGAHLRVIGGRQFFDRLTSVTVDKKGERIYTVDIGGVDSNNHRVRVFNAQTGAHLFDIPRDVPISRGNAPGYFNLPRDVAIGKDGRLYVVDGGNFRIQVFDTEGKFLRSFGQVGLQMGSFARPKEATVDPQGNLYVIDAAFANFQIFNPDDELLLTIGGGGGDGGPGGYTMPSGIFVDEDGRIYVVDQLYRKLDVYRPAALGANDGYLVWKAPVQK